MAKRTCKMCGVRFTRWENYSHTGTHTVRCHDCYLAYNRALNKKRPKKRRPAQEPRACRHCEADISDKRPQARWCGKKCRWADRPNGGHRTTGTATCAECGTTFDTVRGRNTYCGLVCAGRSRILTQDQNETSQNSRRRRQRERQARMTGTYRRRDIFERDGWLCQLCHKPLGKQPYPHPQSPSIDHIIPLSQGGMDKRANVQAVHLRCNCAKGAGVCGSQLRLIG